MRKTAAIMFLVPAMAPLGSRGEDRFDKYEIKVDGKVWDVINEDLDNDGLSDIMMYYIENEEHEHEVRILMNQGGLGNEKRIRTRAG